MKSVSIGTQIKRLGGMVDTKDLKERENQFIKDVVSRTNNGASTTGLSERQVEWIDDLHRKHFA